jgi:TPR repeat protein
VDGLSRSLAHYASRLYNATDLNEMSRTVTSDLSLDDSLDETTMAVAKEYANERTTDHHCAETIAGVLLLHLSTKMQLKAAQDVHDQAASAAFGLATLLVQWNNDNHLKEASKLYQSLARFGHGLSLYQLALMSISGRVAVLMVTANTCCTKHLSCIPIYMRFRGALGRGLTQDYDRAHKLLDQAIRQGAVDAYNTLGVLHKNGWGTL